MYISTVHLLSTSGLDYLRELRSQILFESERTPGFEPGSAGCELGVVPRRHGGWWKERAEEYVFIFSLQPCTRKSVREVKIDLQITQNISKHDLTHEKGVNCPKCNHIASSNDGLKNAFEKLLQKWHCSRVWEIQLQIQNQLWPDPTCKKGSFGSFKKCKTEGVKNVISKAVQGNCNSKKIMQEFDDIIQIESFPWRKYMSLKYYAGAGYRTRVYRVWARHWPTTPQQHIIRKRKITTI